MSGLKQQRCVLLWLQRLEIPNQDLARVAAPWGLTDGIYTILPSPLLALLSASVAISSALPVETPVMLNQRSTPCQYELILISFLITSQDYFH